MCQKVLHVCVDSSISVADIKKEREGAKKVPRGARVKKTSLAPQASTDRLKNMIKKAVGMLGLDRLSR